MFCILRALIVESLLLCRGLGLKSCRVRVGVAMSLTLMASELAHKKRVKQGVVQRNGSCTDLRTMARRPKHRYEVPDLRVGGRLQIVKVSWSHNVPCDEPTIALFSVEPAAADVQIRQL